MTFSRVSKGSMLSVARSEGPALAFLGFKDKDVEALRAATSKAIKEEAVATRQAPSAKRHTAGGWAAGGRLGCAGGLRVGAGCHSAGYVTGKGWASASAHCAAFPSCTSAPAPTPACPHLPALTCLPSPACPTASPHLPACSGHNWGKLAVEGGSLAFRVGGRPAFTLPLPDVSQAQQGREEVMLEFPIDDTVAGGRCAVHAVLCMLCCGAMCSLATAGVQQACFCQRSPLLALPSAPRSCLPPCSCPLHRRPRGHAC